MEKNNTKLGIWTSNLIIFKLSPYLFLSVSTEALLHHSFYRISLNLIRLDVQIPNSVLFFSISLTYFHVASSKINITFLSLLLSLATVALPYFYDLFSTAP